MSTLTYHEGDQDVEEEGEEEVRKRVPGRPFTPESARFAAQRSAEAARERKAQRDELAELDKLTVAQRFSTALARKLPYAELELVVEALLKEAKGGKVQAAKLLLDYIRVSQGGQDPLPDGAVAWAEMSAEQRAVARARLLIEIQQMESPASDVIRVGNKGSVPVPTVPVPEPSTHPPEA